MKDHAERIEEALSIAARYSGVEGAHHKAWVCPPDAPCRGWLGWVDVDVLENQLCARAA